LEKALMLRTWLATTSLYSFAEVGSSFGGFSADGGFIGRIGAPG
jgi:hypothetical protein